MPNLEFKNSTENVLASFGKVAVFFNLMILFIAAITFIALGVNVGRGGAVPEEIKRTGMENLVRKSWAVLILLGVFVLIALFRISSAVLTNKNFASTIGLLTFSRFFI